MGIGKAISVALGLTKYTSEAEALQTCRQALDAYGARSVSPETLRNGPVDLDGMRMRYLPNTDRVTLDRGTASRGAHRAAEDRLLNRLGDKCRPNEHPIFEG